MGYKVTFESGHVVNFENEPTYADINEAEKQLGISKGTSLVDRIPGLAPEVKQPPEDTSPIGVISNVGNALGSGLETVASIGSGLTSGMAGSLLGGWNALVSGRDFVKGTHEGGEALTYHPRLDQAQSDTANINEELNRVLAPMMGHMSGFSVPLKPIKGIKPKVEIPPEVSPDVKKTLLATAVKNVENKLNLVKQKEQELSGFENLSPDLHKEQEFLYQQRLKLEADLEHLNSIMGVTKEKPSFTNREDIINAISDTEKQIQAFSLANCSGGTSGVQSKPVGFGLDSLYNSRSGYLKGSGLLVSTAFSKGFKLVGSGVGIGSSVLTPSRGLAVGSRGLFSLLLNQSKLGSLPAIISS